MLINTAGLLCLVLSLGDVASSRAVEPPSDVCSRGVCKTNIVPSQNKVSAWINILQPSQLNEEALQSVTAKNLKRSLVARAEPVIIPDKGPEGSPEGDPEGDGGSGPNTDPSGDPDSNPQSTGDEPNPSDYLSPGSQPPAPGSTTPEAPSAGNNPPTLDPDQAIGLQDPKFAAQKTTFKDAVAWLEGSAESGGAPRLPVDKTIFYSGKESGTVLENAIDYAGKHDLVYWGKALGDFRDGEAPEDTEENTEYIDITSAAMARAASGDVKFMLDKSGIHSESKLGKLEWPELMASGKVETITWLDSNVDKPEPSAVIYRKAQGSIPAPLGIPVNELIDNAAKFA